MFTKLKRQWQDMRKGRPGERFQRRYAHRQQQRSGIVAKVLYTVAGSVLMVLGLVLMPAPGPGFLVLLPGAAMVAEESLWAARALDWLEVRIRAVLNWALRAWKRASTALKTAVVALGTAVAAVAGWGAYLVIAG